MKHRYKSILISAVVVTASLGTGCIQNDIPFEVIPGNITSMEIRGAESLNLNNSDRVIDLVLSDTVDLRRVFLEDFHITAGARIIDNVTQEAMDTLDSYYLDLTQGGTEYAIPSAAKHPYTFTVITYQDYVWTLKATQNIVREFTLGDGQQIGESKFSATGYSVTAYVPESVPLTNIQVESLKLGPSNATLAWVKADGTIVENVDPKTIHDFTLPQRFLVKFFDITQEWIVTVEQSAQYVTELSVNPWAQFAYLSAQGLTSAGTCSFQVRKAGSGDNAWTNVAATVEGVSFTATAKGLTPATQYEVRGVIGENYGDVSTFTTDGTPEIPNLNFDAWTLSGTTWYPNADAANSYWSTGNEGVTMSLVGKPSNSVPTDVTVDGTGRAAKLTTIVVPVADIAAGNLFAGTYKTDMMKPASSAVMGRPYIGRPTRMTGWYKYTPQQVTIAGNRYSAQKHPDAVGKMDFCSIYIRLENWNGATVRPADPKVIASATFETDQVVSSYTKFDLTLDYTDKVTIPDHIVIVSSSSRYGEDFCGGPGSVLYVDQFELSFEYPE